MKFMKCNQICPYNTLKGCLVEERNGVCPLSNTHPADVVQVRHGRWRFCGSGRWNDAYECDNCGKMATDNSNYCPNCGARMDGEGE